MRIFDCFMFYDEEVVLDIRLNSLKNSVDCFVIVESKFYHNGKKRDLKFDISKYPKFKDKIIYIVQDDEPPNLIPKVSVCMISKFNFLPSSITK